MDIDLDTLDAPPKSRVDSTTSAKKNDSESNTNKTTKQELMSDTNMNQTNNENDETENKIMNDNETNKNKNESKAQDIEEDDQDLVDKLNEKSAGLLPGLRWAPVGPYFRERFESAAARAARESKVQRDIGSNLNNANEQESMSDKNTNQTNNEKEANEKEKSNDNEKSTDQNESEDSVNAEGARISEEKGINKNSNLDSNETTDKTMTSTPTIEVTAKSREVASQATSTMNREVRKARQIDRSSSNASETSSMSNTEEGGKLSPLVDGQDKSAKLRLLAKKQRREKKRENRREMREQYERRIVNTLEDMEETMRMHVEPLIPSKKTTKAVDRWKALQAIMEGWEQYVQNPQQNSSMEEQDEDDDDKSRFARVKDVQSHAPENGPPRASPVNEVDLQAAMMPQGQRGKPMQPRKDQQQEDSNEEEDSVAPDDFQAVRDNANALLQRTSGVAETAEERKRRHELEQDQLETAITISRLQRELNKLKTRDNKITKELRSGTMHSPLSSINGDSSSQDISNMEMDVSNDQNDKHGDGSVYKSSSESDDDREEGNHQKTSGSVFLQEDLDSDDQSTGTNQATNNQRRQSQAINGITRDAFDGLDYRLNNLFRYDVKITVPEYPEKPTQALMEAAYSVFEVLKDIDPSIELHPYLETNVANYNPICKLDDFPLENETEFKAYFIRCTAKDAGGPHYSSVLLGHNTDYKDMMLKGSYKLRDIGSGLYVRDCQAEILQTVGFLLYSLREWEIPHYAHHLLRAIMEHPLGKKCLASPPGIMCRWRIIPTGDRGPMFEEDKIRAIGIDVEADVYNIVKEIIAQLYSVGTTEFPGGLKARLLPDPWSVTNAATKEKVLHLRNRQAHFVNDVQKMRTSEIATLDRAFTGKDKKSATVRERMMAFRMHDYPNKSLFHSVDRSYDGKVVVVSFLPDREAEARSSIAGLLPRLVYECGDSVFRYFKPDAVSLHSESRWDPKTCQVQTKDDDRVEEIEAADEEMRCGKTREALRVRLENIEDVRRGNPESRSTILPSRRSTVEVFRPDKRFYLYH